MKSLKKMKIGAVAMAATMLVSSVSAFACANDQFIAYDHFPDGDGLYAKLYKCPVEGRIVKNGYANKVEWKLAFYEAEYPHRKIEELWLDDTPTGYTRFNGVYAEVNTKELPDFWESRSPYWVYNRLYSDFTGAFERTNVLVSRGETAPVATDWVKKGFDKYVIEDDGTVKDYSHVYGLYDGLALDGSWTADEVDRVEFDWNGIDDIIADYWNAVTYIDDEGNLKYTDAFLNGTAWDAYKMFDDSINYVSWLELAGPDYVTGGTNRFQPFAKVVAGSPAEWYDDLLVTDNAPTLTDVNDAIANHVNVKFETSNVNVIDNHVDSDWVTVGYELEAPYRYIEYLSIDGVIMDGREIDIAGYNVEKEEVVNVFPDMPNRIQLIRKDIELDSYESSEEAFYVFNPTNSEANMKINETWNFKVIEDYLRETKLFSTDMDHDASIYGLDDVLGYDIEKVLKNDDDHLELRFVKVTSQPGKTVLPRIWRYSGGYANPKVEWKTAFAEAAKPYEIYEEKFVDGKATGVYRSTGRYATDVPTLSADLTKPRVLTVMLKDTTDSAAFEWELQNAGYDYYMSDRRVTIFIPTGFVHEGHEDYEFMIDFYEFAGDRVINID